MEPFVDTIFLPFNSNFISMKRIIFFHLYNDISGSPKVLSMVVRGLVAKGYEVELFTSNTDGFLSGIENVIYHKFPYKWTSNKSVTLCRLLFAQLYMFVMALKYNKDNSLFYINTICPFAPALAGKIKKIPVVYHVHEVYIKPNLLHRFYAWMWRRLSSFSFFVSRYVQEHYLADTSNTAVVYNALPESFINRIPLQAENRNKNCILMISSFKVYKGVNEFVDLAFKLPQFKFCLVLNTKFNEVRNFIPSYPDNLEIFTVQNDIHPFLQKADLLLNLTIPSLCVETFGLTLLEAMAYGVPVICPPVGGPIEFVKDNYNGFKVDSRNLDELCDKISFILNGENYDRLSVNAKQTALKFNESEMIRVIDEKLKEF